MRQFQATDRDREVLFGYTQGLTHREIGKALGISASAASVHAARMHLRMGARDRAQAVHIAYQLRILTVGGEPR